MSASGNPMPLAAAEALAARIGAELAPFCEHFEVVGSVRRRRPLVNDLDFAVLLRPGAEGAFRSRALAKTQAIRDGENVLSVRLQNGRQVEFYFARREAADLLRRERGTLGLVRLIRTGSKNHNVKLCAQAKKLGLHLNPNFGVFGPRGWKPNLPAEIRHSLVMQQRGTAECLAAATEEEIFECLKVPFVAPELRE